MKSVVIFGGTGFIGCSFATSIIDRKIADKVYLLDIKPVGERWVSESFSDAFSNGDIVYQYCDVRKPIQFEIEGSVVFIANFAAVHREPGHEDFEYFETNLLGAENVCSWADFVSCKNVIFTSSIAPYGPSEIERAETSLPVPVTAYGSSKLTAEKIHLIWLNSDKESKKLTIVRPGVVFGPGEGGNVSRMVKAVIGGYFFYMGNQKTRKAGVYVKELCNAMLWVNEKQRNGEFSEFVLFNMSMDPGPSIEEYVASIQSVSGVKKKVFSLPYGFLLLASFVLDTFLRFLKPNHPFSPVRIRKLVRSNNVVPVFLRENGYPFLYSLESALKDWKRCLSNEWE